jgi:hypothetical protein
MRPPRTTDGSVTTPGVRVAVFVVLSQGAANCGLCKRETLWESPSPDGRYFAIVSQFDCGATGGPWEEVRLSDRRWWLWWRTQPVFSMLSPTTRVEVEQCGHISVAWGSNRDLHVRAPPAHVHAPSQGEPGVFTTNIQWQNEWWRDVHITYEFDPPPPAEGSATGK